VAIYGDFKQHYKNSSKLFVYERNYEGKRLLVICSFSADPVKFTAPEGFDLSKGTLAINTYDVLNPGANTFDLKPYEARVYLFE
jgi:oligo-1,6-glucosidase